MSVKRIVLLQLMICVVVKQKVVLVTREWRVSPTRIVIHAKRLVCLLLLQLMICVVV